MIAVLFIGIRSALLFLTIPLKNFGGTVLLAIVNGLAEISGGTLSLSAVSPVFRPYLGAFFLSLGGICVYLQSKESLKILGVSGHLFLSVRLACGLLSGILLFCLGKAL